MALEIKITLDRATRQAKVAGLPHDPATGEVKMPHLELIRDCMPVADRRKVRPRDWHYGTLVKLIYQTADQGLVSTQTWAQAILDAQLRSAGFNVEATATVGGDDTLIKALAADAPAYILAGTQIYRLTPDSKVDGTTALKLMVKRNQELVKRERENVLTQANNESRMLISAAENKKAQIEVDYRKMQQELNALLPAWLSHNTAVMKQDRLYGDHPWRVGLHLFFSPTEYMFERGTKIFKWPAKKARLVQAIWWMPINFTSGTYNVESSFIDATNSALPHASHSRSCARPEGLPKTIKSMRDLEKVVEVMNRTFSVVNMGSLLVHQREWSPEVAAFAPPELRDEVKWNNLNFNTLDPKTLTDVVVDDAVKEANTTWSA